MKDIDTIMCLEGDFIADAEAALIKLCEQHGVTLYAKDLSSVKNGAAIGFGTFPEIIGHKTFEYTEQILVGKTSPSELPIHFVETARKIAVNLTTAHRQGLTIPKRTSPLSFSWGCLSRWSRTMNINSPLPPFLHTPPELRVMSYNIRMAPCPEDEHTENAWKHRLAKVSLVCSTYQPDIIGFQEISQIQSRSLQASLTQTPYRFLTSLPAHPPYEAGLALAYNTERLKGMSALTKIWLSEQPLQSHTPAWDASGYERFIICAQFFDKITHHSFWFFTTHFDHQGRVARMKSADLLLKTVRSRAGKAIITGDFNCFAQQGGAELYQQLASQPSIMKNAYEIASQTAGAKGSWIGWDYDPYHEKHGTVQYDYIFTKQIASVAYHAILDDTVWDPEYKKNLYPSDHRPIMSDLIL